MVSSGLAIIIPYFKNIFFEQVLESLSLQTNKNFTVYIGDDCSPFSIKDILERFEDKLTIKYTRFAQNLGSSSLTKQWERCIALSDEEWIWLFSDDDIIEKDAVQVFYDSANQDNLLYKFNTKVIDEAGKLSPYYAKFDHKNIFESTISAADFINNRLACHGFRSFAVEYVFHRSLYDEFKFVDFPLAWGSDDATWFLYSLQNGGNIRVLKALVYWRFSGANISSDVKSLPVIDKKLNAAVLYVKWIKSMSIKYKVIVSNDSLLRWLSIQVAGLNAQISFQEFKKIILDSTLCINTLKVWISYLSVIKKNQFISLFKN